MQMSKHAGVLLGQDSFPENELFSSPFYNNHPSNGRLRNGESLPKIRPAPYV